MKMTLTTKIHKENPILVKIINTSDNGTANCKLIAEGNMNEEIYMSFPQEIIEKYKEDEGFIWYISHNQKDRPLKWGEFPKPSYLTMQLDDEVEIEILPEQCTSIDEFKKYQQEQIKNALKRIK